MKLNILFLAFFFFYSISKAQIQIIPTNTTDFLGKESIIIII